MSQIEKLLQKFSKASHTVRYADIEKILIHVGFENIHTRGSHVKWKHKDAASDIIVPVHNNECKRFYKQQIQKQIHSLIKKSI
jgi:predicted RNA binding protein YcfA (HicA-like mRNA interferase family)